MNSAFAFLFAAALFIGIFIKRLRSVLFLRFSFFLKRSFSSFFASVSAVFDVRSVFCDKRKLNSAGFRVSIDHADADAVSQGDLSARSAADNAMLPLNDLVIIIADLCQRNNTFNSTKVRLSQ